jgi:hypothetical protein
MMKIDAMHPAFAAHLPYLTNPALLMGLKSVMFFRNASAG